MAWLDGSLMVSIIMAVIFLLFASRFFLDNSNVLNQIRHAFTAITDDRHIEQKKAQMNETLTASDDGTLAGKLCKGYPELIGKYIQAGSMPDGTILNGYVYKSAPLVNDPNHKE
jgi:hypothetical protein